MTSYGSLPEGIAPRGTWYKVSFSFSIDNEDGDWDRVDSRSITRAVAGYFAAKLCDPETPTVNAVARGLTITEEDFIKDEEILRWLGGEE